MRWSEAASGEEFRDIGHHGSLTSGQADAVDDLVDGIIRLADSGVHQPVNIGNPNEFTLLELAQAVIDITGSRSEIVYEALPTDDPQVRQPDITLARELLGWEPTVDLREGLQRTLDAAGTAALTGTLPA